MIGATIFGSDATVGTKRPHRESVSHLRDGSCVAYADEWLQRRNCRGHCAGDSGGAVTVAGGGMTAIDMSLVCALGIFAT